MNEEAAKHRKRDDEVRFPNRGNTPEVVAVRWREGGQREGPVGQGQVRELQRPQGSDEA